MLKGVQDLYSITTQKIISSHISGLRSISIIKLKTLSYGTHGQPLTSDYTKHLHHLVLLTEKGIVKYLRTCAAYLLQECSEITTTTTEDMVKLQ